MKKESRLIIVILVLGAIIAVMTARPEIKVLTEERATDSHSDIFFTYTTVRYPVKVEIQDPNTAESIIVGLNVDVTGLNFGTVLGGGGYVKRQINLTSRDGKTSKIYLKAYGNVAPMITFDRNGFLLNSKDSIYVTLNAGNYPGGNYTGEVDVIVQRSNNDILKQIIGY